MTLKHECFLQHEFWQELMAITRTTDVVTIVSLAAAVAISGFLFGDVQIVLVVWMSFFRRVSCKQLLHVTALTGRSKAQPLMSRSV